MSAPETIRIDEVEYVRKDSVHADGEIKIVVVDKGFVYVGRVSKEDDEVVIRQAKNIRYWGTTKGLGELVHGPTSKTKLDDVGVVRVPEHSIVHYIEVEQSKWQ